MKDNTIAIIACCTGIFACAMGIYGFHLLETAIAENESLKQELVGCRNRKIYGG